MTIAAERRRPMRRAGAIRPNVHDQGLVVPERDRRCDDPQLGDEAVLQVRVAVEGEGDVVFFKR